MDPRLPTVHRDQTPERVRSGQQFDTKMLLAVVFRRRWIILAVSAPIVAVAMFATWSSTASFTASTRVLVEARQPENPVFDMRYVEYDVIMSTEAQVAQSIPVATKAAHAIIDSVPRYAAHVEGLGMIRNERNLRDLLLHGTSAGQVGESNILEISFSHPNPRFALLAVAAVNQAYREFSVEKQQNYEAVAYYSDQITKLQADIDSLMSVRARVIESGGLPAMTQDARTTVQAIRFLEHDLYTARTARRALETRVNHIRGLIAEDPDYVPPMSGGEAENLRNLKNTYDSQMARLNELIVQYTDESQHIKRQEELVALTRQSLVQERDAYIADVETRLAEARSKEQSLEEAVAEQTASLTLFPDIEQRLGAIKIAVESRQDLLESLHMKRGAVALKAGTDSRVSQLVPLNDPAINSFVAGSKKVLYLGLASVFALVLGLLTALFVENQDHRIYDRRAAEMILEVPVLGAISPPVLARGRHAS